MLNTYTREDMTIYIDGKLKKDPRFLKLAEQDARVHDLAVEVSTRANGVFFWVYLVVQDLLRGMNDGDDIKPLQRRLEALPTDLEEYFQHMLDRLDHIYQERTAQTLMVAVTALNPVSAMAVYCIEHDRSLAGFIRLAQIQAIDPDQYQYVTAEANLDQQMVQGLMLRVERRAIRQHRVLAPYGQGVSQQRIHLSHSEAALWKEL
jgi:hypothetical protein